MVVKTTVHKRSYKRFSKSSVSPVALRSFHSSSYNSHLYSQQVLISVLQVDFQRPGHILFFISLRFWTHALEFAIDSVVLLFPRPLKDYTTVEFPLSCLSDFGSSHSDLRQGSVDFLLTDHNNTSASPASLATGESCLE